MEKQKNLIRLSNLLLDSLSVLKKAKLLQILSLMADFRNKCLEVKKNSEYFNMAVEKSWLTGAETIRSKIGVNLKDFSYHLQKFKEIINEDQMVSPVLSDIYAELIQIEREVGDLDFDLKEKTISVTTEPITLDDIPLGQFKIQLSIDRICRLYNEAPYSVIALQPNPAGSDDNITHPHVSNETLCEGDGRVPIRSAIEQGRLYDFFTMVINILQTYNPDSPYVALSDWQGISCYNCGYNMAEDDLHYCEHCEREYCSSCSTYCRSCDTTICLGCAYECPSCNEPVCSGCTGKCKECEETYCVNCLTKEGLCHDCEEQRKENENEEQLSKEPKTGAAV